MCLITLLLDFSKVLYSIFSFIFLLHTVNLKNASEAFLSKMDFKKFNIERDSWKVFIARTWCNLKIISRQIVTGMNITATTFMAKIKSRERLKENEGTLFEPQWALEDFSYTIGNSFRPQGHQELACKSRKQAGYYIEILLFFIF